jgi:hypothetical protein
MEVHCRNIQVHDWLNNSINIHALTVLGRTDMSQESDSYWTSEQLEWMEDQVAMYSWCYEDNNLLLFWPSLFEVFFACWPERQTLLPNIPESQVLTDQQHRALSDAEDYRKMVRASQLHCYLQAKLLH